MQSYPNSTDYTPLKPPVLVIGNFDGVHKGHQELISAARDAAHQRGTDLVVMTFEPHPRMFFAPDAPSIRISSPACKMRQFKKLGVDCVLSLPFNHNLANLSADQFLTNFITHPLNPCHIFVGYDFKFGKGRSGSVETLKQYARKHPFELTVYECIQDNQETLSSSRVREAIRKADFTSAQHLLGRAWEMESPVIHGDKRGRELGYPTANQYLGDYLHPPFGVYAVRACLDLNEQDDQRWLNGVANIGIRPMFKTDTPLIETYLFDFNQDIYNQILRIQPIQFLREEAHFSSLKN